MTKEEYDNLPPYEKKSVGIYNTMKDDDDIHPPKVINYLCPRRPNDPVITGVVKQLPPINYDIQVKSSWIISAIKEKMYTKKGELRKKYVDMPPYEQYTAGSLMMYANQCYKEKSEYALISWQERKWLLNK